MRTSACCLLSIFLLAIVQRIMAMEWSGRTGFIHQGCVTQTDNILRKSLKGRQRRQLCASISTEGLAEVRVTLAPGLDIITLQERGWGWVQSENKYGNMVWPGAKAVSKSIAQMDLQGKRVLELGAGTGLCSIAAASLGASVLATDLNEEPLMLLQEAAARQNLRIDAQAFDILGSQRLPQCDILLAADCIYNNQLGEGMARRVAEAKQNGVTCVIGSSVKRPGYALFLTELSKMGFGKDTFTSIERIRDFSSPLIFLDVFRGNFEQEVIQL